MSVFINWVDYSKEMECSCDAIPAAIGIFLVVHHIGSVITRTDWCFSCPEQPSLAKINQSSQIQQYLNNPTDSLVINLQKQGTAFRNKVWAEICRIPVGQVLSYSDVAKIVGSGARAVANACRDNPFPGLIPCHRVVAVAGLGGYMGETSGKFIEIKKKLLKLEAELIV